MPRKGRAEQSLTAEIHLSSHTFVADRSGALYWPAERMLIVADLHLEKASSAARNGTFLPPYDTASTLASLGTVVARHAPRLVVALGDSFHDGDGPGRLDPSDRTALRELQRGREWIWMSGNHDPDPATDIGGTFAGLLCVGGIVLRHEPSPELGCSEIAGHLHPLARVATRARLVSRKCFVSDGRRMVMPAFGAFTGGLNIRNRAFAALFDSLQFTAHMLGAARLYAIAGARCLPD
ncbi:MAG: ligase-associated DNA damage response endonuclease PdeM [Pseudorhodoplanes sp.]|nr:ligase-associated DNA damage response endonuclease PdeM [Pseudorhodoplanes sp.]